MPNYTLPEATKELRSALNLSQQKFADRLAVGLATVQRWEQGTVQPAPAALVALYQVARGVDREDLAGVFLRGGGLQVAAATVDERVPSALIFDILPAIDRSMAEAARQLTNSIFTPDLTKNQHRQLASSAVETLMQGRELVGKILRQAHGLPEETES